MCLAIPGKIITINGDDTLTRMSVVEFGTITREASLLLVPDAKKGDYVLVHAGVAISVLNEEEAQKTFEYLAQIEEVKT